MTEKNMDKIRDRDIEITTRITRQELYEFIMHNNYFSFRGVFSILFSLISLVGTIYFWEEFVWYQKVLMLFMSCMFTVITPIEYYIRAGRQVKKNFQNEMTYIFNKRGITIKIKEDSSALPWNEVMKVISTKNLVVVYFTPIRAFIIPKKSMENEFESIKSIMRENTSCYRFIMEK